MTAAAWPDDVPQAAIMETINDKPERNVASDSPTVGVASSRRRTLILSDSLTFDTFMTFDEYDLLMEFYREDISCGTLTFTRKHPRDPSGSDVTFKFTDSPSLRSTAYNAGLVSMSVRLLP